MAADAISFSDEIEVDPSDIAVSVDWESIAPEIAAAAQARSASEAAQLASKRATGQAIAAGRAAGLTVRDVGSLLGVSPAYVSRLANEAHQAAS